MKKEIFTHGDLDKLSGTAILKFYTDWCVPCKVVDKVLQNEIFEEYDFTVFEIDADSEFELTEKFLVNGIPTLIFLKDGREVGRMSSSSITATDIINGLDWLKP